MVCLLAIGLPSLATTAEAASAGQSFLNAGESASKPAVDVKYRRRGPRIVRPIAPSYLAYDYPYYYSRGYYPTHIGPGYISLGHSYAYQRSSYQAPGKRCSYAHRRCAAN